MTRQGAKAERDRRHAVETAKADKAKRAELVEEYKDTLASPFEAAKNGYVDFIVSPEETRSHLISVLDMLSGKRVSKMPKKHGNMPL